MIVEKTIYKERAKSSEKTNVPERLKITGGEGNETSIDRGNGVTDDSCGN